MRVAKLAAVSRSREATAQDAITVDEEDDISARSRLAVNDFNQSRDFIRK